MSRNLFILIIFCFSLFENTVNAFSCKSNIDCLNDGNCHVNTGLCECILGYSGENCNNFIGCLAGSYLSCQYGGTCLSTGYCACVLGYRGTTCQQYVGCRAGGTLACLNSGVCGATGSCTCKGGYRGSTCSTFVGCTAGGSDACVNQGTCLVGGRCNCLPGFGGPTCSAIGCQIGGSLLCLNGGRCSDKGICICATGFSDSICNTTTLVPTTQQQTFPTTKLSTNLPTKETTYPPKNWSGCDHNRTCWAYGDPHYLTSGGYKFNVKKNCSYLMVSDECVGQSTFQIITHHKYKRSSISWINSVDINYKGKSYTLDNNLKINSIQFNLPFDSSQDNVRVYKSQYGIIFETDGFVVKYDAIGFLKFTYCSTHRMCGLCEISDKSEVENYSMKNQDYCF